MYKKMSRENKMYKTDVSDQAHQLTNRHDFLRGKQFLVVNNVALDVAAARGQRRVVNIRYHLGQVKQNV
jgi:hypothetical protein